MRVATDRTSSLSHLSLLIRKLESVAPLPDEARAAIQRLPVTVRTLSERTSIVHEGDRSTQCCLILEGWACRSRLLDKGQRQIVAFYVPGDVPDIESLHLHVADQGLSAMARTTVAFIAHKDIRDLLQRCSNLTTALWRDTLVDAVRCRERVTSLGRRKALGRMAHLFCEMYLRLRAVGLADEMRFEMPLTQSDLADALGISSVHTNRSLQDLRRQGVVTLRSGQLTVHDWDKLAEAAEFDPAYLHLAVREP